MGWHSVFDLWPDPRATLPLGLLSSLLHLPGELVAPPLLLVVRRLGRPGTGRLLSGIGRPERDLRWGRPTGLLTGGQLDHPPVGLDQWDIRAGAGLGPRTRAASGGAIDAADDKRASVGAGGPASGPLGPGCHAACGEGGVFRGRGRDAAAAAIQPPATHGLAAHCHGSRDGSLRLLGAHFANLTAHSSR